MDLPKDPVMLYSFINLKLRDYYSDLDALCEDMNLDRRELEDTLKKAGFEYQPDTNSFL